MKDTFVGLGTLLLVLTSMLLRSAIHVLTILFVLWVAGTLYPFVADALGVPERTLYDFTTVMLWRISQLLEAISDSITHQ